MSRRSRRFGKPKSPRFRMLPDYMLNCAAWKSLSKSGRAAFIEMLGLYNGTNNGRLVMAARALAKSLPCGKSTAARLLTELELKGFIGVEKVGAYGRRIASEYYVTLHRNDVTGELPTKAFMRWVPPPAVPQERRKRMNSTVPKRDITVPPVGLTKENCRSQSHQRDCDSPTPSPDSPTSGTHIDLHHQDSPSGERSAPVGSAVASSPLGLGVVLPAVQKWEPRSPDVVGAELTELFRQRSDTEPINGSSSSLSAAAADEPLASASSLAPGPAAKQSEKISMLLPKDVHRVMSRGKEYLYFKPGRGTKKQSKGIRLPSLNSPDFLAELRKAQAETAKIQAAHTADGAPLRKAGEG